VYSTYLRAFTFAFGDAGANLVLLEWRADGLVVGVGGIGSLKRVTKFIS
jgi:hypothetical protein